MSMQGLKLAIIGATGAVGRDLVELLTQQGAEPQDLLLFASPASVGKRVELGDGGKRVLAMPADPEGSELFDDIEVVFFACPSEVTRAVAPVLAERGLAVVCAELAGVAAEQGDHLRQAVERRQMQGRPAVGIPNIREPVAGVLRQSLSHGQRPVFNGCRHFRGRNHQLCGILRGGGLGVEAAEGG